MSKTPEKESVPDMVKKKLGLLVPAANTIMETDFHQWLPESVGLFVNRLYASSKRKDTLANLQDIDDHVEESARILAMAKPDVILFGCTSGSFLHGLGWDQEMVKQIEHAAGGIPAVTTSGCVLEALHEMKLQSISVVTPYPEDVNDRLKVFLRDAGFTITSFEGLNLEFDSKGDTLSQKVMPDEIYEIGVRVDRPEADGLFISCTSFRAGEAIERLEQALRKPVVTANQASLWSALRHLEIEVSVPNAGLLFRQVAV